MSNNREDEEKKMAPEPIFSVNASKEDKQSPKLLDLIESCSQESSESEDHTPCLSPKSLFPAFFEEKDKDENRIIKCRIYLVERVTIMILKRVEYQQKMTKALKVSIVITNYFTALLIYGASHSFSNWCGNYTEMDHSNGHKFTWNNRIY